MQRVIYTCLPRSPFDLLCLICVVLNRNAIYLRLAIHLQHLSNTPVMLQNLIDDTPMWRGSEEVTDDRFLEPIHWKKFSHICTASVKYDPSWSTREDVSFIVTGVQLHVKKHDSKTVLHLRLRFSKVRNSFIAQKNWMQGASELFLGHKPCQK